MVEYAVDDLWLGDEGNYPHFFAAPWTGQGVNFEGEESMGVDLLDRPLGRQADDVPRRIHFGGAAQQLELVRISAESDRS